MKKWSDRHSKLIELLPSLHRWPHPALWAIDEGKEATDRCHSTNPGCPSKQRVAFFSRFGGLSSSRELAALLLHYLLCVRDKKAACQLRLATEPLDSPPGRQH